MHAITYLNERLQNTTIFLC